MTATIDFSVSGQAVHAEITVPRGPTRPVRMLPIFNAVAETIIQIAAKSVEEEGATISCRKGCGACCRQLVPIADIEAARIRDLINELPESRRSHVRARFADAREDLKRAGLLEQLRNPEAFGDGELQSLGISYFNQGIPCPFLEDESCSIHADRPIACREYLVTSPAEHCADPTRDKVLGVRLAAKVSKAVRRMGKAPSGRFIRWVPLILADEWADEHAEPPTRPGPELLREFFDRLVDETSAKE